MEALVQEGELDQKAAEFIMNEAGEVVMMSPEDEKLDFDEFLMVAEA